MSLWMKLGSPGFQILKVKKMNEEQRKCYECYQTIPDGYRLGCEIYMNFVKTGVVEITRRCPYISVILEDLVNRAKGEPETFPDIVDKLTEDSYQK